MAVESDVIGLIAYDGDGTQTAFTVTFLFSIAADLVVVTTVIATGIETTLVLGTDYSVSGGGGDPGVPTTGTVTTVAAVASGSRITIKRNLPLLQPLTLVPNTALPSASLMYVLDRLTLMVQDQFENFTRALSATVGSNLSGLQINSLATSSILQVDAIDNTLIHGISLVDLAAALGVATSVSSFGTFAVSGQSSVVADAPGDTLTLVAGTNITITTNAGSDAITINASGGGGGGGTTLVAVTQSAHGFSVGQALYLNGATYTVAACTSAAAAEVVGVVSTVTDSNDFNLTTAGRITGLTGLTAGQVGFLDTSAGGVTTTQQTTIGNIDKPVWVADSTTSAILIPTRGVVVGNAISAAAQSDVTTATSATTYITPSVQKYIPGASKAWARLTQSAGTYTLQDNLNVASFTKNSTGNITITFTAAMADANYCVVICTDLTATSAYYTSAATGSLVVNIKSVGTTPTATDAGFSIVVMGAF